MERRLAAILAADVVGYSALMQRDESGTHRRLSANRREVFEPEVTRYRGRIFKFTGDGFLAEFSSVMNAVQCAVVLQRKLSERNSSMLATERIHLRIGINLGEVIVEKDDLIGDGVNIAARLEQFAPPGGVCLSEDAYRQIRNKLDMQIVDAGEKHLKNISQPVQTYHIEPTAVATAAIAPVEPVAERRWNRRTLAIGLLIVITLSAGSWFALTRTEQNRIETVKPPQKATLPLVAVLPLANQTGDPSQEYFADGVTEEIINALGRFNVLRVIGHNAVLPYKERPPTKEQVVSELGANYLVGGSVRRSGSKIRISAQLTDSQSGMLMWTDTFNGELAEVFDFQSAIAREIAGTLASNITLVEGKRSSSQARPNLSAFDLSLQARAIGHASSRTSNRQFRELVNKAIELDPNYAASRALLAEALYSQAILGWTEHPDQTLSRGAEEAQKAIALAPDEPDGYRALGRILLARAEYAPAQNALKTAIELNPSDADALASWGSIQSFSGDIVGAIQSLELALKLDPLVQPNFVFDLAVTYYLAGRYDDALRMSERGLARFSDFVMFNVPAAAASAKLGRKAEASLYVEKLRRYPGFDLEALGSRFRNPKHPADLKEGLRLAGY